MGLWSEEKANQFYETRKKEEESAGQQHYVTKIDAQQMPRKKGR